MCLHTTNCSCQGEVPSSWSRKRNSSCQCRAGYSKRNIYTTCTFIETNCRVLQPLYY